MGEVKIKSGNLFDLEGYITKAAYVHNIEITLISNGISIIATSSDDPYINPSYNVVGQQIPASAVKRAVINCKPNTAYTLSLHQSQNVSKRISYFNSEFTVIKGYDSFNGTIFNMITPENCAYILIRIGDSATLSEGTMVELTNIQLLEGTYTSETIPEYQPYFLNKPAHQVVNGQFVDIPTHHFINGRWQGELTSQSPLKFWADGDMLDWRIEGRTSGNLFDINGEHISSSRRGITCFIVVDDKLVVQIISPGGTTRIRYPNNFYNPNVYTVSVKLTGELTEIKFLSTSPFPGGTYNTTYRAYWKAMTLNNGIYTTTFAPTETATIGFAVMGADDARNPGTVENIQLLEGTYTTSTLPPYEPYGGVGDFDETAQKYRIPVNVRGDNLYSSAWEQGFWSYDTGAGWGTDSKYVRTAKMSCKGNTKYEFVCSLPDGSKDYGFVFWDTNGNYIGNIHSSDVQNTPVKYSVISPANAKMMAINIARYSDGERHPSDILSFDLYELHETNIYTDHQLMDGDSIDYETTETQIPIATGNNILTVNTAVQPSKVFLKFEG